MAILTFLCLAGIPSYDWHSNTFTYRSSSFRSATFREIVFTSSLFVSIFPVSIVDGQKMLAQHCCDSRTSSRTFERNPVPFDWHNSIIQIIVTLAVWIDVDDLEIDGHANYSENFTNMCHEFRPDSASRQHGDCMTTAKLSIWYVELRTYFDSSNSSENFIKFELELINSFIHFCLRIFANFTLSCLCRFCRGDLFLISFVTAPVE